MYGTLGRSLRKVTHIQKKSLLKTKTSRHRNKKRFSFPRSKDLIIIYFINFRFDGNGAIRVKELDSDTYKTVDVRAHLKYRHL